MRAYRAWRLVSALELNEVTSVRVLAVFADYDDRALALLAENRDVARELRTAVAAMRPNDAVIERALGRWVAIRARRHGLEDERFQGLRRWLSAVQQARLLLLLPRLERELVGWANKLSGALPPATSGASGVTSQRRLNRR